MGANLFLRLNDAVPGSRSCGIIASRMSLTRRRAIVSAILSTGLPLPAQGTRKAKALIVDGFSNHDWRKTTSFLKAVLSESGLFELSVSTSPGEAAAPGWDAWSPAFSGYDVVVLNMNNIQQPEIRWPRAVEQALEAYVAGGGGLLVFHSANNSFPHWREYDRMIGLGWRSKDHGWALRLDAAGKITRIPAGKGEATSHGPRQDTEVIGLNPHPITHGTPKRWLTPDIEVYRYARGPAEELTVLTYGRHIASDSYWPLEWVVNYGKGRVYNSSFGHIWKTDDGIPDRVRCVGFQTSLIRAAEWVATGTVSYPVPSDFPSEHAISLRRGNLP